MFEQESLSYGHTNLALQLSKQTCNEDIIEIDISTKTISLKVDDAIIAERKNKWTQPELKIKKGVLYKYAMQVKTAAEGCVTDEN